MTAIFSLELSQEPQYVDLLDVAAGYGSLSVPVTDLLSGDTVDAMYLTIQGDGLTTIASVIDQIQRTQGFYEWTDSESVDGHFTLTAAQTAAIAVATSCTYSVQVQITRSGTSYTREVQSGNINARPAIPSPPMIVASVSVTGGPVIGGIGSTTQLAAVAYDSFATIVPGVAFSWTSADDSIATVSSTGLVTIHALGATTIYATASGVFGSTLATGTVTPFAVGSIPYASSVSAISMLPIGTPNQYLRTNAGATAPEWDTLTAADIGPGVFQAGDFTFGGRALFSADNLYDIGGSGVTRPRDLNLGRNLIVGGTTSLGGVVYTWPGSQSANKVLKTDGAGNLSWATPTEEIALTDLTDVTIAGAANGQVLRFNSGSGLWENSTVGTQLTALNATELTSGTVANARLAGAYTGITGLGTLASDLLFTDATFDIGKVGATRPRDVFASRNVTIGGTIAVTGASTFGIVGAGATTVTTLHASSTSALDGDVTLGARLVFSALAGKIVPGATSISLRNSADGADNVLILDSGAVTFRSTVGGITTLTATSIGGTLTTAAQPNITSLGTLAANLIFVDASFDIGQSGITRPRHGYFSGNVTAGSTFIGTLANTLTIGTHLTGGSFNNSGNITIATDAVSINTVSTIVARDGSGNFSAGTITASLTGAASLNLLLTGGTLAGALLFTDNTFDIGASGLTRPRSGYFGTNVTVGGVFIGNLNKTLTFGAHLISGGASFNNSADVTITSDATSANTASTIVARDGSGNFSAGTITATLVGAAAAGSLSGATLAAGVTASSLTSFGTLTADLLFTDALYDIGKTGATRPRDIFASRNVVIGGTINVTGATTLGAIAGLGTISSDLLFTDATYDIGKSAATRPRDLFISRNLTAGGTAAITGAVTLSSTLSIGGNVVSDVLFTDATFDIGKSGATRPRDGFFSRNFVIGGTLGVTGNVTFSGTGNTIGTVTSGTWNGSVLGVAFGGTNLASYTIGDVVYASGATTISKLAIGTAGQSLVVNGGATAPSWHTLVTADVIDIATATTGITKVGALAIGSIATGFGGASFGGNVITSADATYDLGASGANRFRDAFFSRNITAGGSLSVTGTLTFTNLVVTGSSNVTTLVGTGAMTGFTTANFSSTITAGGTIAINAATAQTTLTSTTGTNQVDHVLINTGGTYHFGVENSAGGAFGATAYAQVIFAAAARNIEFFPGASKALTLTSAGGSVFAGNITAGTDATYDFGASGANRFRDLFLSRSVIIGTDPTGSAVLRFTGLSRSAGAAGGYQFDDRATGDTWTWFATGGVATLTTTVNSPITVTRATGAVSLIAGLTVANALTVSAGTTAVQALTATNITGSGTLVMQTGGASANQASVAALRFSSSTRLESFGANASTLGGVNITGYKSDGSGAVDYLILAAGTGAATFSAGISATGLITNGRTDSTTGIVQSIFADNAARSVGLQSEATRTNASTHVQFINPNGIVGSISTTGSATAFNTSSDMRLKIDHGPAAGVDVLRALVVHDFSWIADDDGTIDRGVFAQEAWKIKPTAVSKGADATDDQGRLLRPWGVDYSKFVPDLIVGWQEHDGYIALHDREIAELKAFRDRAIARYPNLAAA